MLIKRKSDDNFMLSLNIDNGHAYQVTRSEVTDPPERKAFYEKYSGGYICVMASTRGPFLAIGGNNLYFVDDDWDAEVERLGSDNVFRLWVKGSLIMEERYDPPPVDDVDPWSDEESDDFFVWLANKRNDSEFIEMWTG